MAYPQAASRVFHLSADSLTLSDNDPVGVSGTSPWVDSINSVSITQATSGFQPLYKTNLFGGKPGVRFDGVDDILNIGRPTALTTAIDSETYTYLVVCRVVGATTVGAVFAAGSFTNGIYVLADGTNLGDYSGIRKVASSGSGLNMVGATSSATAGSGSQMICSRHYLQGGCFSSLGSAGKTSMTKNFCIGSEQDAGFYANVDVFEIIVWDVELTPAEMMDAQREICDKYSQPYPWAAISKVIVFDGDSITSDELVSPVEDHYTYQAANNLGLTWGQWTLSAIAGMQMRNMDVKALEYKDIPTITGKPMAVVAFEYYNENGTAPSTLQGYTTDFCTVVNGFTNTQLVLGSSTSHAGDPDSNRASYNSWLDTNYASLCDSYVALHNDTSIGDSTAYSDNSGTYWQDVVHLNAAGADVLWPLMVAGINALPATTTTIGAANVRQSSNRRQFGIRR